MNQFSLIKFLMRQFVRAISASTVIIVMSFVYAQANDQALRTKEFVVMGYQGLKIDLASGKGPYLDTLTDLLNTPETMQPETLKQLQTLIKKHPNIMDFADQVLLLGTTVEETSKKMENVLVPSGPGIYTGEKVSHALDHLTRGMKIAVTLKTGEKIEGTFSEYGSKRLWIRGATRRSLHLDDILAVEAPQL